MKTDVVAVIALVVTGGGLVATFIVHEYRLHRSRNKKDE